MVRFLFFVVCILAVLNAYSLEQPEQEGKTITLKTAINGNEVMLRWAPLTVEAWKKGQANGFVVERVTIAENGVAISPPLVNMLEGKPFLPAEQKKWEEIMPVNDQAAIIAQSFWGENFELSAKGTRNPMTAALDKVADQNQRFAFSLMAADINFEAAVMAGWAYIDESVKPDGIYRYKVYVNGDQGTENYHEVLVNMSYPDQLPKPYGLNLGFSDNNATLSWENSYLRNIYTAYFIERSVDNKFFHKMNTTPFFVTSSSGDVSGFNRGVFTDSIPYEVVFYYRLRGIDCFGRLGPYSEVVSGKSIPTLKSIPVISDYKYLDGGKVRVYWEFDREDEELTSGLQLFRAETLDGQYEPISDLLPPQMREFIFDLKNSNYVVIAAHGKNNEMNVSGAMFIDNPNVPPPVKPAKPKGEIDSTGTVRLWWPPNPEKNLDGYHVYYARFEKDEFVQLTFKPVNDTVFTDTLSLNTQVKKAMYKIIAVNNRNSHSKASDILHLQLPDTIKPVSPYFVDHVVEADSVVLHWVNSPSIDVVKHNLYRSTGKNDQYELIALIDSVNIRTYTDRNLEEKQMYHYVITATDDSGLESLPSRSARAIIKAFREAPPVEKFTYAFDKEKLRVSLRWKKCQGIEGYQLYRKMADYSLAFYQSIPETDDRFVDTEIKPFTNYKYYIRSKGKNGLYSPFAEVEVNW
ncbi:MAG: hypothetical protein JW798_05935 [Prolixibacteraceae bacterium]|nr:hypothetical protein [Prolixibacteraceae bacterium]